MSKATKADNEFDFTDIDEVEREVVRAEWEEEFELEELRECNEELRKRLEELLDAESEERQQQYN